MKACIGLIARRLMESNHEPGPTGWLPAKMPIAARAVTFDVPEPGTFALLGFGLVGMGFAGRSKKA